MSPSSLFEAKVDFLRDPSAYARNRSVADAAAARAVAFFNNFIAEEEDEVEIMDDNIMAIIVISDGKVGTMGCQISIHFNYCRCLSCCN